MPEPPITRLTDVYVAAVIENGARVDSAELSWARNKITILLHEGVAEDVIAAAIRKMVGRHKFGGYMLGTFVNEVLMEQKDEPDKQMLDAFLDQHDGRWPTGVTFKRGSHGGTLVADPLGYDRAEYGRWSYPTRQEVIDALRARSA